MILTPDRLFRSIQMLVTVGFGVLAAGCGSGGGAGPGTTIHLASAVQAAVTRDAQVDPGLVADNNQMGLMMFDQLRTASPQQNIAISPTSISLALSMVYNGAAGNTAAAMSTAMQLNGMTPQTLDSDNAALQASLVNPDKNVTFTIANSLWTHGTSQVSPSFVTANQTYYAANLGDLSGAPGNVNSWVSGATNGLITNIAPQMDYTPVVAVLVNALYFKGAWQSPFFPGQTSTLPFTTASSAQVNVQMMSEIGPFNYYAGSNFQLVRLPYGTGREAMIVILPNAGVDLGTVIGQITPQSLATWSSAAASTMVWVQMPKFSTSYMTSLNDTLTSMGMGVAFDSTQADFSNLSSTIKPLFIGFVEHATTVEVDEGGTIASAATSVGVTSTASPDIQQIVNLNQPFFYAIQDSKTGELLFVGQMTDPTK